MAIGILSSCVQGNEFEQPIQQDLAQDHLEYGLRTRLDRQGIL